MWEIIDVKENGPERNAKINTAELSLLQGKLGGDKASWDALHSGLKEKVDSLAQAIKTTDLSPLSLDTKKRAVEEIRKINTLATDPSGAEAFAKKVLPPAIQNSHTIKVEGGKIKLVPNPGPRTESSDTPEGQAEIAKKAREKAEQVVQNTRTINAETKAMNEDQLAAQKVAREQAKQAQEKAAAETIAVSRAQNLYRGLWGKWI